VNSHLHRCSGSACVTSSGPCGKVYLSPGERAQKKHGQPTALAPYRSVQSSPTRAAAFYPGGATASTNDQARPVPFSAISSPTPSSRSALLRSARPRSSCVRPVDYHGTLCLLRRGGTHERRRGATLRLKGTLGGSVAMFETVPYLKRENVRVLGPQDARLEEILAALQVEHFLRLKPPVMERFLQLYEEVMPEATRVG
jgi:hypothetical protein